MIHGGDSFAVIVDYLPSLEDPRYIWQREHVWMHLTYSDDDFLAAATAPCGRARHGADHGARSRRRGGLSERVPCQRGALAGFRARRGVERGSSRHARAGVEAGRPGSGPMGGRGGHDLRAGRLGRPGPLGRSNHGARRRFSGKSEAAVRSIAPGSRCTRTCGWQWCRAKTSPEFSPIRRTRYFARSTHARSIICWIPLRWRVKARRPRRNTDGSQFVLPERADDPGNPLPPSGVHRFRGSALVSQAGAVCALRRGRIGGWKKLVASGRPDAWTVAGNADRPVSAGTSFQSAAARHVFERPAVPRGGRACFSR